jgi:DNA primase
MQLLENIEKEYNSKIEITDKFTSFFQRSLLYNQESLNYCLNRGITKKSLDIFHIGYDPGGKILQEFIERYNFNSEDLVELGILTKDSSDTYYDKFSKRIIFPIFDLKGNSIAFSGRIWKDGDDRSKYINSNLSTLYQKSLIMYGLYQAYKSIVEYNLVLLVEGNTDVLACHDSNLKIAVAPCGTSFMEEHFLLLNNFTNRFIFCMDNDEAGRKAKNKIITMLKDKKDIKYGFLNISIVKDIDLFIKNYGVDLIIENINEITDNMNNA